MKVQGPPAAWSMPLTWSRSGERNVRSRFLICVDLDGLAEWSPSGLWSKGGEQRPARGSGKRTLVDRAFVARDRSWAGEPAWNATEGWASPANLRKKLIALVSREARKKEAWAKRGRAWRGQTLQHEARDLDQRTGQVSGDGSAADPSSDVQGHGGFRTVSRGDSWVHRHTSLTFRLGRECRLSPWPAWPFQDSTRGKNTDR